MSDPTSQDPTSQDPAAGRPEPTSGPPVPPAPPYGASPPPPPAYGAAPPPPPSYGSTPSYPAAPQYGTAPTEPPAAPPPPLALAVRLMYLGAALSLVNIVLTLFQRDAIRSQLASQGRLGPAALDAAATATVVVGAVVGLAGTALWVLNAVYNARGRAWARVLSTVLGGLAVLFALASLTQPGGGLSRLLTFVELIIAAAVLALIWRPESSQYYRARSGPPGVPPGV